MASNRQPPIPGGPATGRRPPTGWPRSPSRRRPPARLRSTCSVSTCRSWPMRRSTTAVRRVGAAPTRRPRGSPLRRPVRPRRPRGARPRPAHLSGAYRAQAAIVDRVHDVLGTPAQPQRGGGAAGDPAPVPRASDVATEARAGVPRVSGCDPGFIVTPARPSRARDRLRRWAGCAPLGPACPPSRRQPPAALPTSGNRAPVDVSGRPPRSDRSSRAPCRGRTPNQVPRAPISEEESIGSPTRELQGAGASRRGSRGRRTEAAGLRRASGRPGST